MKIYSSSRVSDHLNLSFDHSNSYQGPCLISSPSFRITSPLIALWSATSYPQGVNWFTCPQYLPLCFEVVLENSTIIFKGTTRMVYCQVTFNQFGGGGRGARGRGGGVNATPHIYSVSSLHFTSSSWKICVLRKIPQLLTCVIYFHSSDLQVRQNCTCVQYLSESTRKYDPLQSSTAHFAKEHNAILKERNKYAATNWGSTCKD